MALDNPMAEEAKQFAINQFAEPYALHHGTLNLYILAMLIDISDKLDHLYHKK